MWGDSSHAKGFGCVADEHEIFTLTSCTLLIPHGRRNLSFDAQGGIYLPFSPLGLLRLSHQDPSKIISSLYKISV